MKNKCVIVLDCGATNVRAVAVDQSGKTLAKKLFPNQTSADPLFKNGLIWDVETIWMNLCKACKIVLKDMEDVELLGVSITTFGVDGAPFDKNGNQLYPVISWACARTESIINELHEKIPLMDLYQKTGVHQFNFNTIYKLFWLQKHHPEIAKQTNQWLFMPAILTMRLCNTSFTDTSMAGTSMLTDLKMRNFSGDIMDAIQMNADIFPTLIEAGARVGEITKKASRECGLPEGLPVFAAGHDTQYAIFGSGAGVNEPVLSSGTWEILMVRTPTVNANQKAFDAGVTTEFDAIPGLYNPGIQWLGSGILEWIKRNFFADVADDPNIYGLMIAEAEKFDKTNVKINPDFFNSKGQILNLKINSHRGEIYWAALNALAEKAKTSLELLEQNCGFKSTSLIVVGGGSKNRLWNEIRSKTLGLPIKTIPQTETTVLGAAMFAFAGCGFYNSAEEARDIFLNS